MDIFEYVEKMSRAEAIGIAKSYADGFRTGGHITEGSALGRALRASGVHPTLWPTQAQGLMSEIAVKFLLNGDLLALATTWEAEAKDEPEGSPSQAVLHYCADSLKAVLKGQKAG